MDVGLFPGCSPKGQNALRQVQRIFEPLVHILDKSQVCSDSPVPHGKGLGGHPYPASDSRNDEEGQFLGNCQSKHTVDRLIPQLGIERVGDFDG